LSSWTRTRSNIPLCDVGTLDDDNNGTLPNSVSCTTIPGSYQVSQSVADGYLRQVSCTDPDGGSSTTISFANIDLDAGETVTCVFKNTRGSSVPVVALASPTATPTARPSATAVPTQTQAPSGAVAAIQPPSTGDGGVDEGGMLPASLLLGLFAATLMTGIVALVLRKRP
jgi:hypothetical protein